MSPTKVRARTAQVPVSVRLSDFKLNSKRLLPSDHPLLKILAHVPDEISIAELNVRIDDWLALLEA
jgi:hypothetical protein